MDDESKKDPKPGEGDDPKPGEGDNEPSNEDGKLSLDEHQTGFLTKKGIDTSKVGDPEHPEVTINPLNILATSRGELAQEFTASKKQVEKLEKDAKRRETKAKKADAPKNPKDLMTDDDKIDDGKLKQVLEDAGKSRDFIEAAEKLHERKLISDEALEILTMEDGARMKQIAEHGQQISPEKLAEIVAESSKKAVDEAMAELKAQFGIGTGVGAGDQQKSQNGDAAAFSMEEEYKANADYAKERSQQAKEQYANKK